jgi:uncharacterized protein YraI
MLKPKNDDKKKKALDKPKGKRQPRTHLTVFLTTLIILTFIIIVLILRSPIRERLLITPTVAARLATLSPDPVSTNFDATAVALQSSLTVSPALPLVVATDTPNSFNIGVTLVSATDLYAGPGLNYPVVEHLNTGSQLLLIGANANYTWYEVSLPQGLAWVDGSLFPQLAPSFRQLPVIAFTVVASTQATGLFLSEGFFVSGTPAPFPTFTPTVDNTATARAILTTTPVLALAPTDVPTYTGPGFNFGTGRTIRINSLLSLVGVSEDRQWYLVKYAPNSTDPLQVWVQASILGTRIFGDVNLLPTITTAEAQGYVTFVPLPTATPSPSVTIPSPLTLTALAVITATPVVALSTADIPIYTGPSPTLRTNFFIPIQSFMRLIGISEDRQWFLVQYSPRNSNGQSLQVWVQASTVPSVVSGDFSFLQTITAAEALGYVTFVPLPTVTPTRTGSATRTRTPTRTPLPSRTPSPTKTPSVTPLPRGT